MKFYTPNLNLLRLLVAVLLLQFFISCAKTQHQAAPIPYPSPFNPAPDYALMDHWAAHPWKKDPSDSLPQDLEKEMRDSVADVFFIYPTTYTGERTNWNAAIDDEALNNKTDYSSILYQSSAFNQQSRVFAPRYRQGHYSAFFIDSSERISVFDTAYADLKIAFQYYLDHYHKDRPIILAGHSQGALMTIRLLKDFFDGKPLYDRLVAAYIIGWPVARNSFGEIRVCEDSIQTGCFCSWRTYRKGYLPRYVQMEREPSFVTNPLNWTITSEYASRKQNRGSVLRNFSRLVPYTTDAQVNENVLWVNKPRFKGSFLLRTRNYHIADINLFYLNLRQNVAQRLQAFQRSKQAQP